MAANPMSLRGPAEPKGEDVRTLLMERARAMVPVLKARAARTEELRRVPDETVAELVEAGFLRVPTTPQYGGYQNVDNDLVFDITMELARGCASTSWCYAIWASHNAMMGGILANARGEYFADGPDTISSTARFAVWDEITPVDGGYRVSGHWKFASGADHSRWFLVQSSPLIGLLIPRSDVQIVDTWYVNGLRGTGSNDIKVDNVFVPAHRVWGLFDRETASPSSWEITGRPSFRMEGYALLYTPLATVIGAAQGAVDAVIEAYYGKKPNPRSDDLSAHSVGFQMRLAEASAAVDAARLLMRCDYRQMLDDAAASRKITKLDLGRYRRNMAFSAKLCEEAVDRLYEPLGARALAETNPILRFCRDTHAAAHHPALIRDVLFEQYGRKALGLPFTGDMFMREMVDRALLVPELPGGAA